MATDGTSDDTLGRITARSIYQVDTELDGSLHHSYRLSFSLALLAAETTMAAASQPNLTDAQASTPECEVLYPDCRLQAWIRDAH